jgi:hypothetical protein
VYFDQFTPQHWGEVETAYRREEARVAELNRLTIDVMRVGEMQPERDHSLASNNCDVREANGKGFRTPYPGGFFEFDLKLNPDKVTNLVVTYWVNDRWKRGGSITIDGKPLSTMDSVNKLPSNTFQTVTYPIPGELIAGKSHIRVRFSASPNMQSGSVSEVRTVLVDPTRLLD